MTEKMSVKDWVAQVNGSKREKSISDQTRNYLAAQRIYCTRQNSGKVQMQHKEYIRKSDGKPGRSQSWIQLHDPGTPDLLVIYRGCAVEIETKMKGGKPTMVQQFEQSRILKAGGAGTINCDSFESFERQWLEFKARIDRMMILIKRSGLE